MDVSYMADNVLILRYFEAKGAVQKAISVFKKRGSVHETTLRQFDITRAASASAGAQQFPGHPDRRADHPGSGNEGQDIPAA
jgi:KaiC/GvpD/RAD55 family RecA-like ATPase